MFARDLLNLHRQVNSLFGAMGSQYMDDDFMSLDPFQPALLSVGQPRLPQGQQQQLQGVQGKDESAMRGRESESLTTTGGRGKTELSSFLSPLLGGQLPSLLSMSVDVHANDVNYSISCDLPGVDKQSIDIEADKASNTITIKAEKKQEIIETQPSPTQKQTLGQGQGQVGQTTSQSQTQPQQQPQPQQQQQQPQQQQQQQQGRQQGQELTKTSESTAVGRPRIVRQERVYGMVQRSLRLANDADLDHIEAKYENGVLKLTVPRIKRKEETSKARKINVQ